MKKLFLEQTMLKAMFKSIKATVDESRTRPMLEYARVEVGETEVNVISCDGFKMSNFSFEKGEANKDCEPFVCYIKPVNLPSKISETKPAELEFCEEDNTVTLEIKNNITDDIIKYIFIQPTGDFFNWRNIYKIENAPDTINFNPRLLTDLLKTFVGCRMVTLHFNHEHCLQPFYVTAELAKGVTINHLLMPIATAEDRR